MVVASWGYQLNTFVSSLLPTQGCLPDCFQVQDEERPSFLSLFYWWVLTCVQVRLTFQALDVL